MLKKGANVFGLIVILLIIGSAFVGVVSAEEIIIDTEIDESSFTVYPSKPIIGWYHKPDHDTFHTRAYNGNFWYTLCGEEGHEYPLYFGLWLASLPQSGNYEVFVWIPDPDPFVTDWQPQRSYTPTKNAVYQIYHKAGRTTKTVNQELRIGGFYSLGTFNFDTRASVILDDRTGESYLSTMIAFDAVKFVPVAAPNTPPYTPSNPSPATHATGQSIHTDLDWTGGDPDAGDTVTYDVYFGTSTSLLKVSTAQSGTTYDPGTLKPNKEYYWKIEATDNDGAPTTGPLWNFTTGSTLTCAIELRKNGAEIDEIDVGEFFDIYVGDSTDDTGIKDVRFSSDDSQDGIPTGEWRVWYEWSTSSGDWNVISKTKAWLFTTEGSKEVWAEVKDGDGQTRNCFANIVTENLYRLAKAIMSEASVGTQEERIAVGWTVLNRLESNEFPSTIKQVVESGYAYNQEPTKDIIDLSKDILERKYSDPTGGATYFFSPRSMTSGYGPYEISGTNKKSLIPSWAIPKGYSKTSPPPSDWEMTEFYKTIENLEWVSGLEDIRIWYFMFYRPISDSQEELIHSPIQQERIVEKDVPVTIEGNQYIIATLRHKIDPETLRAIPDSGEVKVYLDTEGNPVSDEEIARKIGIIDYVRHLQAGGLEDELYEKYDDVNKKMLVLGTIPLAEWPIEAIETIPRIIKVSTERLIQELIEIVGKESVKHLLNTKEELRAEADMNFQSAWNEYFKACQVLRRNKEIVDYSTAYTVLENTLLGDFHEKMGSFICSKIYEPKMGKLFIREFAKVLTWGISEEALARIVHIDYIIENYYEGNMVQCQLSKEPYEFTSYTLELSQVSPTLSNEFNSCITEIEENTAKIYKDVADYLVMFSPKDYLSAIFKSPGELRVYDSQERVTGLVNGEIKEKIPHSIYDNESKIVVIFTPSDSYRYEIVGTGEGAYGLEVTSVKDGNATTFTATDIPTTPGAIHQYTIDWAALSQGEKGVTVKIVSDGVLERTIITNNSFYPLIAEFTFSPKNPLVGEKVTLDASTSFDLGGGVIKKYCWEFYNAANQDPFYVIEGHDKKIIRYSFTSEGIYIVRLTVTDDEGEYSYTESSTKVGSAKSDEDVRLGVPFFSQRDPEWKDQKLGKSTWTIGDSGCALTSAAMVSKYFGWDIDPLRLDAALTEIDGISTGGNLNWAKVEEASGGYVNWIGKKEDQEWSNIDQQLSEENPCIINGYWNDGKNPHKVVIQRKVGTEHHFWDPWDKPPRDEDRIWPNGVETYTWGNEESGNEELYDPRIYLYHKGALPLEKNQISVIDEPPYFYKWSNLGDLKSWKKKKCEGHTYYSTYVGGMYYGRNKPNNDPNKPDCWMEFTPYLQSAGKYDIYVGICADSTRSTKVKYTIYPNGVDGSSETVSKSQYSDEECWKEIKLGAFDLTGEGKTHVRITDATGEAFDGKKTLCVGTIRFTKATDTLNILTPTQTAYRNVGVHDNPTKTSIEVEIKTSTDAFVLGLTNRDDYTVKIGDKTADVLIVIQKSDRYVLEIMPPKQAGDGKYDLHVVLGSLSDVENDAINYGTKGLDVALIIDSSGSMSDNDPEGYRKTAAKYFVDLANTGDKICVADFGHNDCDSRLLLPLLEITDESSRDTVKTAIDQVVSSGATPIGGGLEKGYDELSSPRAVAGHNKAGILLTDGKDTCDTEGAARTYAQKFGDNGWVLYTIGLTGDADEDLLQKLAAPGNGEYYKAPTNKQLMEIYDALSGRVAGKPTMDAARGTAQQGSTSVENALIDSSVTEVKFTISWAGSDFNLTLKKPDGGIIDPDVAETDPNVIYTSASSYEFYTVQSPMPGEWVLMIFGADVPAGGEEYTARVMGTSNLTMNMYFDRDHYSVGEPIKVSVSLTDALQPITEASVIADIELSPTASSSLKNLAGKDTLQNRLSIAQDQITLFDDGMHGDGMANDGVYANFYTNTDIEGTYKFTAKATGTRSPEEFERVIEQSIYVSVTPTPRPILPPTPTPTPRLTLTPAPGPTLTPTPRPTLRPTATLFEKIEGLTAAIRVGAGI